MSIDNVIYALSNYNAVASSALGYVQDKQNGVPTGFALSNAGYNIMNGVLRNEVSREIQQHTGSYMGYMVNSLAGYGNPVSNYVGTVGTMQAAMLTSPFGIFGCRSFMPFSTMYGIRPFGGGCCCNNFGVGLGMRSFFSPMGFLC